MLWCAWLALWQCPALSGTRWIFGDIRILTENHVVWEETVHLNHLVLDMSLCYTLQPFFFRLQTVLIDQLIQHATEPIPMCLHLAQLPMCTSCYWTQDCTLKLRWRGHVLAQNWCELGLESTLWRPKPRDPVIFKKPA